MSDVEPLIISELEQMLPLPDGGRTDWADVLHRAGAIPAATSYTRWWRGKRRRWRPVLVAAVAVAVLVGAGVAIADGLGAFNGLSDAQHPQVGAAVLDPATLATIEQFNSQFGSAYPKILPDTARLLGQLPAALSRGAAGNGPANPNVYAVSDSSGDLCLIYQGSGLTCGLPLSQTHPVSGGETNATGSDPVTYGIAMDGITAVSFEAGGQDVTVPVKNNLWYYAGPNSAGEHMTVHFADGSSEPLNEDCTMPLQQARATVCGGNR